MTNACDRVTCKLIDIPFLSSEPTVLRRVECRPAQSEAKGAVVLGWFAPKCPLSTWEKTWTESRMRWLADRLGIERLLKATVVEPTAEFFPEEYRGEPDQVRRMLDRLCFYMGVDPLSVDLEVCLENRLPGAAGQYERGAQKTVIRVSESVLPDPTQLVATLAHELAHEVLIGGGLLQADETDHEWITDLLPAYLGVGIFGANASFQEKYCDTGVVSWWTMGKTGYLPARMSGYAMALFAWIRGEEKPAWADHLRLDALAAFREGMRYLLKTGDALFDPASIRKPMDPLPASVLASHLQNGSPSTRLAAIWAIQQRRITDGTLVSALTTALGDRDESIASDAAKALGMMGDAALPSLPGLVHSFHADSEKLRANAVWAAGQLRANPDTVIPELVYLLKDRQTAGMALEALWHYGSRGAAALPHLPPLLGDAIRSEDDWLIDALVGTLRVMAPDVNGVIRDYFSRHEPDLLQEAQEMARTRALEAPEPSDWSHDPRDGMTPT